MPDALNSVAVSLALPVAVSICCRTSARVAPGANGTAASIAAISKNRADLMWIMLWYSEIL